MHFSVKPNRQQDILVKLHSIFKHLYYIFIDFVYNHYLPPVVCFFVALILIHNALFSNT